MKRPLFGTSGIRGHAEKLFTNQFSFDIGRAFAKFLTQKGIKGGVAIGMDPRGSSPRIKDAIIAGLETEGCKIFDQGAAPVPAMCYLLQISQEYGGSIMVSGSHIKAELNGVKFFAGREEILKKDEKKILEIYNSIKEKKKFKKGLDRIHVENAANEEYKEMLVGLAKGKYPKWKVVIDPGDGAQSDVMPQVLKRLGIQVIEQNATIQGKFMARDTESIQDMKSLIQGVVRNKADFGIGYDADGDRAVFVDSQGNFIPGDYTAAIIAQKAAGETVVTPVATSQVVDHLGKRVIRTKVGSPYVVEAMKKHHAKVGFEANGGVVSAEIMMSRDGGSTTIKFLNILSQSGKKKIEKLIAQLPKFYLSKTKIDYPWELEKQILAKAAKKFKGKKVEKLDGLKIWLDDQTWLLFRSSQNAPEFRIFAESKDKEKAKTLMHQGVKLVKEVIK